MPSSWILRRVALVRTDVSEELRAYNVPNIFAASVGCQLLLTFFLVQLFLSP
jgi:hypothetical protein